MCRALLLIAMSVAVAQPASADSCDAKFKKLAEAGVPMNLLNQMAAKVKERTVVSKDQIALVDYSKSAVEKRMFIINLGDGTVQSYHVAHGAKNGGHEKATEFTLPEDVEQGKRLPDEAGSRKVSLGLYQISRHKGVSRKVGPYLDVQGLEKVNREARRRRVLIQAGKLVSNGDKPPYIGRSWGSFSVDPKDLGKILEQLQGSVLYAGLSERAKQSNDPGPEVQELFRCQGTKRPQLDRTSV